MNRETPLLALENACKTYVGGVRALDRVNLELRVGESVGLVGESGSGKSTLVRCLLLLETLSDGEVVYRGESGTLRFSGALPRSLPAFRRAVQVVLQNPYGAFDPHQTMAAALDEPLRRHGARDRAGRVRRCSELLTLVRLDDRLLARRPHELSGGQLQRVAIARALSVEPRVLVLDEAVTALDASVRVQVLDLLTELRDRLGLTLLFVSHDLAATCRLCDRLAVMYAGRIVEELERDSIFASRHPYTRALVSAASVGVCSREERIRELLRGEPPDPVALPSGCKFRPRCRYATLSCWDEEPELKEVAIAPGHRCACLYRDTLSFGGAVGRQKEAP